MKHNNKKNITFVLILLNLIALLCATISLAGDENASKATGWLGQLDIYAKVFGGAVTVLGAFFGLPITILHFRKTKAEIRKLELEAQALSNQQLGSGKSAGVYDIEIHGEYNTVKILTDPRFLAPLLLLLDFIIAWIVLTIAGYALGLFIHGSIRTIILLFIAGVLLIPIFREAKRVKSILRPEENQNNEGDT